jgi:hypothetical protein
MPKHSTRRLDPADVLARRVRPTAVELMDLIHRVNPTGRDLPPREAELRYTQKSRLQSLLVRTFADELTVVPDPAQEGTVSLQHRGHGRDACHAVVAELDEDARAWVQRRIDLGPPSDDAPRAPAPAPRPSGRGRPAAEDEDDDDPEALVRRAERAVDAYDYEAAQAALARATRASGGAPGPAAALLALLVETLGDDTAALALAPSLSRAALADARVRAPLALAAARQGDEERALALLRGLDDAPAGAALAALAGAALAAGDADRAAAHLAQAKARTPADPVIAALAGEIGKARALARRDAEAELGRLVEAGRDDEAARRAEEVLARWPESEPAGRALRAIAERRRLRDGARLAAGAEDALRRGAAAEALALLGRALGALGRGPEREAVALRIEAIEAAERAKREAAEVVRVARLLAVPEPREGLLAYLDLAPALQERVRREQPRDALAWLDRTAPGRGGASARVDAVVALGRALAGGEPEAVATLLEPHAALLEPVPEAQRLLDEARAHRAAQRAARARAALAAARAALGAGETAAALDHLAEGGLRDLPEDVRAEIEAVRARAEAVAVREARAALLAAQRAGGRLFDARDGADELAEGAAGAERARWMAVREEIQAEIQAWFRVEVDTAPESLTGLPIILWKLDLEESVRVLTPDGRRMVLAQVHERWVLVRVMAWETDTVETTTLLRTPEPLGVLRIEVRGPRLWLVGRAALELSLTTGEIVTWRGAAEVVPPPERAHDVVLVAGEAPAAPRFLWALPGDRTRAETVRVIDVDRRRVAREVPDIADLLPLIGGGEPRLVCAKIKSHEVHQARGPLAPGGLIRHLGLVRAVAPHPDGQGLVALGGVSPPYEENVEPLVWMEITPEGAVTARRPLDGSSGRAHATVAVSHEAGMMFVVLTTAAGGQDLLAFRAAGGRLEEVWRTPVPAYTLLATDAAGRRVVSVHATGTSLGARLLGPEAPTEPAEADSPEGAPPPAGEGSLWFPTPSTALACGRPFEGRGGFLDHFAKGIEFMPADARREALRKYLDRDGPIAAQVYAMALERVAPADVHVVLDWLHAHAADHTITRLMDADALLRAARWDDLAARLDGADANQLREDNWRQRHLYHLRALAALHTNELERARDLLAAAREHEGDCELDKLEAHVEALLDTTTPFVAGPVSPFRFKEMMRVADALLDAGKIDDVLGVLTPSRNVDELQSLARRAEAYLRIEPEDRHGRLRKLMTLARLVEIDAKPPVERPVFPLGDDTWTEEGIAETVAAAKAWLSAAGARPAAGS